MTHDRCSQGTAKGHFGPPRKRANRFVGRKTGGEDRRTVQIAFVCGSGTTSLGYSPSARRMVAKINRYPENYYTPGLEKERTDREKFPENDV